MKTNQTSGRGVAVEVVLLIIALTGGAGFFGVREVQRAALAHKQEEAAKQLEKAQHDLEAANNAANLARDEAAKARQAAEQARQDVKLKQTDLGGTIQQASAEAKVAVGRLPASLERDFLTGEFNEIDFSINRLFEAPSRDQTVLWRNRAVEALKDKVALEKELADQKAAAEKLAGQLLQAVDAEKRAEAKVKTSDDRANAAQHTTDLAVGETKTAKDRMLDTVKALSDSSSLAFGLKLIVIAIAGVWLLGLLLKIFALGLPTDGPWANALHVAANTFHSVLAPMAVLAETTAKKETNELIQGAGQFVSDVKKEMPVAKKDIIRLMDATISPRHQRKICKAHIAIEREEAATDAETKLVAACAT